MLGSLILAVLLIDPSAARTDVSGGVSTEVRGGWAPVTPISESSPAFALVVTPNIDLRRRQRRYRGVLSLTYSPRMFLRLPNQLSLQRPLFFHNGELAYARALTPTWQLNTSAAARYGELDYSATGLALDTGQTNTPNATVLTVAIFDGSVGFRGSVSRRTNLDIVAAGGTQRPILGDDGVLTTPTRNYGRLTLAPGHQLTARDELRLSFETSLTDFEPGAMYVSVDSRLGWSHQLRQRLRLTMDAGVFVNRVALRQDDTTNSGNAAFPVGSIGLDGRLRSRVNYTLDGSLSAGVFGIFDVASGRLLYRSSLIAATALTLPPRWALGIDASFVTAITPEPIDTRDALNIPETLANLQTPVTYTIDETKSVEFGARFSVRAPHLASESFATTRYEAWGYVAFRIAGGTARGRREVTARRAGS
jgi:hypothetical protein